MTSKLRIEFDTFAKTFTNVDDLTVKAETAKGPVTLAFIDSDGKHVYNWNKIVAYHIKA